jgi:hypothetical protein
MYTHGCANVVLCIFSFESQLVGERGAGVREGGGVGAEGDDLFSGFCLFLVEFYVPYVKVGAVQLIDILAAKEILALCP